MKPCTAACTVQKCSSTADVRGARGKKEGIANGSEQASNTKEVVMRAGAWRVTIQHGEDKDGTRMGSRESAQKGWGGRKI